MNPGVSSRCKQVKSSQSCLVPGTSEVFAKTCTLEEGSPILGMVLLHCCIFYPGPSSHWSMQEGMSWRQSVLVCGR